MQNPDSRAEAERLLSLAAVHLQNRSLKTARDYALSAQDKEPLLERTDQVIAVVDVLSAGERRVNSRHLDWYAILQIKRRTEDLDLIKKQYRRLAFLLHPDKNRFAFADQAFKLVADAWSHLSDPNRKSAFDSDFGIGIFTKVNLVTVRNSNSGPQPQPQPPTPAQATSVRRSERSTQQDPPVAAASAPPHMSGNRRRVSSFWTACPYCYVLHQYHIVYEGCCMNCPKCERTFEAIAMGTLPPLVPGKDAYYCCWGLFPVGFAKGTVPANAGNGTRTWIPNVGNADKERTKFPNWMQHMGTEDNVNEHQAMDEAVGTKAEINYGNRPAANGNGDALAGPQKRGRGRPRKNPIT